MAFKFQKEIDEAIEKLRPIKKVPVMTNMFNKPEVAFGVKELNFVEEKGDIPDYIAFEWETGFVVMTQVAFNKLKQRQKALLMAKALPPKKRGKK